MPDAWYSKLQDLPKIASVVLVDQVIGGLTPDVTGKRLLLLQQASEALISALLIVLLTGYLLARPVVACQARLGGRTLTGGHAEVRQGQSLILNVEVNVDGKSVLGRSVLKRLAKRSEARVIIETTPAFAVTLSVDFPVASRVERKSGHRLELLLDRSMRDGTVAAVALDVRGEATGTDLVDVTWTTTVVSKGRRGAWRTSRWARVRSNLSQVTVRSS